MMHQVQQTESFVLHGQTLITQNLQGFQCEALLVTTSFFTNNKKIFEIYRFGIC